DRGRFGFEAERQIEPRLVGAQSPRMAVTFGPEGVVFGPTGEVVLNRVLRPVIRGVSQAMIAGIPAHHYTALAATSCHRGDPASRRMPRHFNVEDLSVCESDDEEDVKRLEQDRRDAEKVASPNLRRMPRQELSPRPGWAPAATHSHIFGHGPGGNLKP